MQKERILISMKHCQEERAPCIISFVKNFTKKPLRFDNFTRIDKRSIRNPDNIDT